MEVIVDLKFLRDPISVNLRDHQSLGYHVKTFYIAFTQFTLFVLYFQTATPCNLPTTSLTSTLTTHVGFCYTFSTNQVNLYIEEQS